MKNEESIKPVFQPFFFSQGSQMLSIGFHLSKDENINQHSETLEKVCRFYFCRGSPCESSNEHLVIREK